MQLSCRAEHARHPGPSWIRKEPSTSCRRSRAYECTPGAASSCSHAAAAPRKGRARPPRSAHCCRWAPPRNPLRPPPYSLSPTWRRSCRSHPPFPQLVWDRQFVSQTREVLLIDAPTSNYFDEAGSDLRLWEAQVHQQEQLKNAGDRTG